MVTFIIISFIIQQVEFLSPEYVPAPVGYHVVGLMGQSVCTC